MRQREQLYQRSTGLAATAPSSHNPEPPIPYLWDPAKVPLGFGSGLGLQLYTLPHYIAIKAVPSLLTSTLTGSESWCQPVPRGRTNRCACRIRLPTFCASSPASPLPTCTLQWPDSLSWGKWCPRQEIRPHACPLPPRLGPKCSSPGFCPGSHLSGWDLAGPPPCPVRLWVAGEKTQK